jgi:hypothetical protein
MPHADNPAFADRSGPELLLDSGEWVRHCWFAEVMPPTWAWAYRRLLNAGQDRRDSRSRVA